MPNLPTFNVSQLTADRLLAAFSGQFEDDGITPIPPVTAYKKWLRAMLTEHVATVEGQVSRNSLNNELPLT